MQKTLTLTLDDGVTVVVREFKVKAVKELVGRAKEYEGLPLMELFTRKFYELAEFLKPYVDTEIEFDELTFSEIETILNGLMEVNQAFFKMGDQLAAYLGKNLVSLIEPALQKILSETPPAGISSSAASTSAALN